MLPQTESRQAAGRAVHQPHWMVQQANNMSGAITGFIPGGITGDACFIAGTAVLTADGLTAKPDVCMECPMKKDYCQKCCMY